MRHVLASSKFDASRRAGAARRVEARLPVRGPARSDTLGPRLPAGPAQRRPGAVLVGPGQHCTSTAKQGPAGATQ